VARSRARKLLDARHAALVGAVIEAMRGRGWEARPELTFSRWGERGSIDIFGWHPARRAVAVVEAKSTIADLQDMLSTMDRKRRLAADIAEAEPGWRPVSVGSLLALRESNLARRQVAQHMAALEAALPARTVDIRRWMRKPDGPLEGIWFLRCSDGSSTGRGRGGPIRVQRPKTGE
jgi:hypothetical protein